MTSPDFEHRVGASFGRQGLMGTLGATLERVEPGECWIRVPFASGVTQQHGLFHGGVTATLADNAAGFAAFTLMDADSQPLSVEFKISFIAPARGSALEARAEVLRSGRRLTHVRSDVYTISDDGEHLIATALATISATKSVAEST